MIDQFAQIEVRLFTDHKEFGLGVQRKDFPTDESFVRAVTALCAATEHTVWLLNKGEQLQEFRTPYMQLEKR